MGKTLPMAILYVCFRPVYINPSYLYMERKDMKKLSISLPFGEGQGGAVWLCLLFHSNLLHRLPGLYDVEARLQCYFYGRFGC